MAEKAKITVTMVGRMLYPQVFEPASFGGQEPKYSVKLLISPADAKGEKFKEIAAAIVAAAKEKYPSRDFRNGWPKDLGRPLRPMEEKIGVWPGMVEGGWILTASTNTKSRPQIVGANRLPLTDPSSIYSGCFGRLAVNFGAYDKNGNKGVSCYLSHVMKTADGDPLQGVPADKAFDGYFDSEGTAPAADEEIPF